MTFLDKLKEDNPNLTEDEIMKRVLHSCPYVYGYGGETENSTCMNDGRVGSHCVDCWNREMPNMEFKQKIVNPPSQETLDFIHENIEVLELEDTEVSFTDDLLNQGYTKGINDCIEYIRKLFTITEHTRKELFGCREIRYIIDRQDAQSIIAKLKAYEEAHKIEIGDVVVLDDEEYVITRVNKTPPTTTISGLNAKGEAICWSDNYYTKTGKHIDIQSILEQIGD